MYFLCIRPQIKTCLSVCLYGYKHAPPTQKRKKKKEEEETFLGQYPAILDRTSVWYKLFCGTIILRIGNFLKFAGTKFCGSN